MEYDREVKCVVCRHPFDERRYPVQFSCGLLCCDPCVEAGRHLSKPKVCALHEMNCFTDKSGIKSIDASHLFEQLRIVRHAAELLASKRPEEEPRLKAELEDLQATNVILQNMLEKKQEEARASQKQQKQLKERHTSLKKTVSKFENSLRQELKNELDERKRLERELQQATADLAKANEQWKLQVEKSKAEAAERKEKQKQAGAAKAKKKTEQSKPSKSKWLDIINQHNTDTTDVDETTKPQPTKDSPNQSRYTGRNPFEILQEDDND